MKSQGTVAPFVCSIGGLDADPVVYRVLQALLAAKVPLGRLAAVTLILLIAFALTSAFVLRHSKLARRDHLTAIAIAAQLRASASKTPPSIRAPD